MNNIDNILNNYFDGSASPEEEKILKMYFRSNNILPQHEIYKPLFLVFDKEKQEITAPDFIIPKEEYRRKLLPSRRLLMVSASVAAVALLVVILFPFKMGAELQPDYVVIVNGEKISNPKKAKEYADKMFAQAYDMKKQNYKPLNEAKGIQESFDAARIINEARKFQETYDAARIIDKAKKQINNIETSN
jgi:hypothetical protein